MMPLLRASCCEEGGILSCTTHLPSCLLQLAPLRKAGSPGRDSVLAAVWPLAFTHPPTVGLWKKALHAWCGPSSPTASLGNTLQATLLKVAWHSCLDHCRLGQSTVKGKGCVAGSTSRQADRAKVGSTGPCCWACWEAGAAARPTSTCAGCRAPERVTTIPADHRQAGMAGEGVCLHHQQPSPVPSAARAGEKDPPGRSISTPWDQGQTGGAGRCLAPQKVWADFLGGNISDTTRARCRYVPHHSDCRARLFRPLPHLRPTGGGPLRRLVLLAGMPGFTVGTLHASAAPADRCPSMLQGSRGCWASVGCQAG